MGALGSTRHALGPDLWVQSPWSSVPQPFCLSGVPHLTSLAPCWVQNWLQARGWKQNPWAVGLTVTVSPWFDIPPNRGCVWFSGGQNPKDKERIIFLSVVSAVGWKIRLPKSRFCSWCQRERGALLPSRPCADHVTAKETDPSPAEGQEARGQSDTRGRPNGREGQQRAILQGSLEGQRGERGRETRG